MPQNRPSLPSAGVLSALLLLALPLAACEERQDVPALPATIEAAPPILPAPDLAALPPAPPATVGRPISSADSYAWAERAYALDEAFYEAPPDYVFDYAGAQPWAWESRDDWRLYAEPLETGYRFFYFEPNEPYPYFVRDPDYGYGYDDGGRLVVIYDIAGRLLPPQAIYDRAGSAGRYFARGRSLRAADDRRQRRAMAGRVWEARQPTLAAAQAPWITAASQREPWRDYRRRTDKAEVRRFAPEQRRREAEVARLGRETRQDAERERERQVALAPPPRQPLREAFDRRDRENGPPALVWPRRIERRDGEAEARRRDERRGEDGRERARRGEETRQRVAAQADHRQRQEAEGRRQQLEARDRRDREQAEARRAEDGGARVRQETETRQRVADGERRQRQEAESRRRVEEGQQQARRDAENRQRATDAESRRRQGAEDGQQRMRQEAENRQRALEGERRQRREAEEGQQRARQEAESHRRADEGRQRARQEAQTRQRQDVARQQAQEGERRQRQEAENHQRQEATRQPARQDAENGRRRTVEAPAPAESNPAQQASDGDDDNDRGRGRGGGRRREN